MYGTQATSVYSDRLDMFENDVKMYGTQARVDLPLPEVPFENDVKMYGTQASSMPSDWARRLRMM